MSRAVADTADNRLRRLVRTTVVCGIGVLGWAGLRTWLDGWPSDLVALGLLALATTAIDATAINVRIGHHTESYTWAEIVVVVGLATLAPQHLVLTGLGVGVACALTGRSRVKVLYNTASYVLGLGLAVAVTHGTAPPTWERPYASGLALAAGAVAFSLWNALSINAAIAISQDMRFWPVYRATAGLRRLVMLGNIALALGALVLAEHAPYVLAAVPVAMAVAYAGYKAYRRVLQDRVTWRHLEASCTEMSALDEGQLAEVAVRRAAALLQADVVELCLHGPDGGPDRVHVGAAAGSVQIRTESRQRSDQFGVTTYRALTDPAPGAGPEETCAVVPLMGRTAQIGVLRVRFRARIALTRRERQLLSTYAGNLATNLDNARLYASVREEADRQATAALHDPLTGLPNRMMLRQRGEEAVRRGCAVLLIDLDRFKQVNDTLGHAAGDRLLRELAARLRDSVRPIDTVSRLGGDEFAILLADPSAAEPTAARLISRLAEPVDLDGGTARVGVSIGIAVAPADAVDLDTLLQRADAAMYAAKAAGGGYHWAGRPATVTLDRIVDVRAAGSPVGDSPLVLVR